MVEIPIPTHQNIKIGTSKWFDVVCPTRLMLAASRQVESTQQISPKQRSFYLPIPTPSNRFSMMETHVE